MDQPNAFVTPARIEAALDKYRCRQCGNFHIEQPCGSRTERVWALAEVLDYELRYANIPAQAPVSILLPSGARLTDDPVTLHPVIEDDVERQTREMQLAREEAAVSSRDYLTT